MTLRVVLEQGEDGFLIASVPALPGCLSQGRTRDEAIANIKEAIMGWLESQRARPVSFRAPAKGSPAKRR
jgi:predicted RNase H-like HicB family nuclease